MTDMTPAEFKCLRESMGLSTKWLAERWDVAEYSVQRWERNRELPKKLQLDLLLLKSQFDATVERDGGVSGGALIVPRTDLESVEYPAAWHRAIAQRAREMNGGRILYYDDESDIDGGADAR